MPNINYERIANEVGNVESQCEYLIKCLYEEDFDIHHRYTDEFEYEGEFNLLQLVAHYMSYRRHLSNYFLIIEKLLSKGFYLRDLPDDDNAQCFSSLCGSYNELPAELIDSLVQHGAVINPLLSHEETHIKIPLFEAASVLNLSTMRRLCELGADVNPEVGTEDWESAFAPCLEFVDDETVHADIYRALLLLLEFNFKISSDDFISLCEMVETDAEQHDMQLRCIDECLNISLYNKEIKPFFWKNDDIDRFLDELEDGDLIKEKVVYAINLYQIWYDTINQQHDCLKEIHSFFTLRDYEQTELVGLNEHLEHELVCANHGPNNA